MNVINDHKSIFTTYNYNEILEESDIDSEPDYSALKKFTMNKLLQRLNT